MSPQRCGSLLLALLAAAWSPAIEAAAPAAPALRAKPQQKVALLGRDNDADAHGVTGALDVSADQEHQITELDEVAQELEILTAKDDSSLSKMNTQIVGLVHERDAIRKDKARKSREVSFLHDEVTRIQERLKGGSASAADADVKKDGASDKELAEAEEAAADADKGLAQLQQKVALLARSKRAGVRGVTDMDQEQQITELDEVAQDVETSEAKDDSSLSKMNTQIVGLVHERDAARKDKARKSREISFLHDEVSRIQKRLSAQTGGSARADDATVKELGKEVAAGGSDKELAEAEEAASDADKGLASLSNSVAGSATTNTAMAIGGASAGMVATGTSIVSASKHTAAAVVAAASKHTAAATVVAASVVTEDSEQTKALKAELAEMKAKQQAELEKELAEERAKDKAKADAKRKLEDEAHEKLVAEDAERQRALDEEKARKDKAEALANSADDSFKDFMKDEDGEEDQGDPAYEDSANALAGAIGWDRNAVETNADKGIKQLTEAIGGKKVIQSLQGMMAGVR